MDSFVDELLELVCLLDWVLFWVLVGCMLLQLIFRLFRLVLYVFTLLFPCICAACVYYVLVAYTLDILFAGWLCLLLSVVCILVGIVG